MNYLRTMLCVTGAVLLSAPAPGADRMSARETVDSIVTTIAVEEEGLKRGTDWEREQMALNEQIRQATLEKAWYAGQARTFGRYIESAQQHLADLREKQDNLHRIEAELEGDLIAVVDRLAGLVAADIPFLQQERADRIAFLQKTVGDYDLAGVEKLRRVLEALQVELEYGRTAEVTGEKLTINGAGQAVRCLRIGRMGLYALSADNSRAWRWDSAGGFIPLPEKDVRNVEAAVEMVTNDVATSLPILPFEETSNASNR
jgi:hypothetical protein